MKKKTNAHDTQTIRENIFVRKKMFLATSAISVILLIIITVL
jgi:hypothetical protein